MVVIGEVTSKIRKLTRALIAFRWFNNKCIIGYSKERSYILLVTYHFLTYFRTSILITYSISCFLNSRTKVLGIKYTITISVYNFVYITTGIQEGCNVLSVTDPILIEIELIRIYIKWRIIYRTYSLIVFC